MTKLTMVDENTIRDEDTYVTYKDRDDHSMLVISPLVRFTVPKEQALYFWRVLKNYAKTEDRQNEKTVL